MTDFGYTLMTEQAGPTDLVEHSVAAEEAGFDFAVMSDHYSPWLTEQGHAPYAWSVLGAVAQATSRLQLMSYVTCPTMRYHPAVVAQKAATVQLLSEGRFTLGLGSGENLNEHVIGAGWPAVATRHEMLAEALEIIRALLAGELLDFRGDHFRVDAGRLWDRPAGGVPIGLAVGGPAVIRRCAALADHLVATEPRSDLIEDWRATPGAPAIGDGARAIAQIPISWDPSDVDAAVERAHRQFRWFGGGWQVNADVPTTAGFAGATKFVRPEDVARSIPCGPDLDAIVETVRPFWKAGFTDIALVQIDGATNPQFLGEAAEPLLARLRDEYRAEPTEER
ncbi:G6PDH family F420-dependent oxidoreductase [Nocardioides albertanoniae]|uniref:G6PDH family F420-dependent oxidoreductase n=1 Tax=Nocardioides albertanoniae TaxID=1175486 RepID=A0A543A8L3_9ACTN|nr:TIGR03557 family F420-dependent LLM class oxidoreductase [Nocardioides albertanoniae]TQL68943.1 G6PDH family F420-dependent oxidoreductase [Nocardioides albertanoniae]